MSVYRGLHRLRVSLPVCDDTGVSRIWCVAIPVCADFADVAQPRLGAGWTGLSTTLAVTPLLPSVAAAREQSSHYSRVGGGSGTPAIAAAISALAASAGSLRSEERRVGK